jgi:hypothetical protein
VQVWSPHLLLADSWWGYAEADPNLTGVVVLVVTALASVYLLVRIPLPPRWERHRARVLGAFGFPRQRNKQGG